MTDLRSSRMCRNRRRCMQMGDMRAWIPSSRRTPARVPCLLRPCLLLVHPCTTSYYTCTRSELLSRSHSAMTSIRWSSKTRSISVPVRHRTCRAHVQGGIRWWGCYANRQRTRPRLRLPHSVDSTACSAQHHVGWRASERAEEGDTRVRCFGTGRCLLGSPKTAMRSPRTCVPAQTRH